MCSIDNSTIDLADNRLALVAAGTAPKTNVIMDADDWVPAFADDDFVAAMSELALARQVTGMLLHCNFDEINVQPYSTPLRERKTWLEGAHPPNKKWHFVGLITLVGQCWLPRKMKVKDTSSSEDLVLDNAGYITLMHTTTDFVSQWKVAVARS